MCKFNKLVDIAIAMFDPERDLKSFHYSFILYKNRVISIGQNNRKTNPVNIKNLPHKEAKVIESIKGTCSEYHAIQKLKSKTNIQTDKCIMINIRIDRNKDISYSKPCNYCRNLLRYFNFKRVYFSTPAGKFEIYE